MAKKTSPLLPGAEDQLRELGARLRAARLRRRLTAKQVAERSGMAPMTLRAVEAGGAGVTIGAYASVLQTLGLTADLGLVAAQDPQGRAIQDAHLLARRRPRTPVRKTPVAKPGAPAAQMPVDADDWVEICADALKAALPAGLIASDCWRVAIRTAQVPSMSRMDPREAAANYAALRATI